MTAPITAAVDITIVIWPDIVPCSMLIDWSITLKLPMLPAGSGSLTTTAGLLVAHMMDRVMIVRPAATPSTRNAHPLHVDGVHTMVRVLSCCCLGRDWLPLPSDVPSFVRLSLFALWSALLSAPLQMGGIRLHVNFAC